MLVAFAKLQGYDDAKIKRLSEVLQRSTDLDEGIKDKVAVAGETEESVFTALGLQCPEPQLRSNRRKACLVKNLT
jgi:hypothetical protein